MPAQVVSGRQNTGKAMSLGMALEVQQADTKVTTATIRQMPWPRRGIPETLENLMLMSGCYGHGCT